MLRSEIRGAVSGLALVAAFLLAAVSIDFDIPGQALLQTLRFHIAAARNVKRAESMPESPR